jgi:DNA mismatch endonuclease (patch repair protein)
MTDIMTSAQRSNCMSKIKGSNTKPELLLRKSLWEKGYRYRLYNKLPGKPDFIFSSKRLAVFVDGCFWHCCPQHGVKPKSNQEFWEKKLQGNIARDKNANLALSEMGWTVCRFWEHEVKNSLDDVIEHIIITLTKLSAI